MKVSTSLFALCFVFCFCLSSCCEDGRNLINGFFTAIKGSAFHLDDNCLDSEFDDDVQTLQQAIKDLNLGVAVQTLKTIFQEVRNNCNLSDAKELNDDARLAFVSGKMLFNSAIYSEAILVLVKNAINNKHPTPYQLGQFAGGVTSYLVYGRNPQTVAALNNNFLYGEQQQMPAEIFDIFGKYSWDDILDNVDAFIDGVLSGVAVDPNHNECKTDIVGYRSQIVASVKTVIIAIQTKTDIVNSIFDLVHVISGLPDFKGTCNIDVLKNSLQALTSKIGLIELFYRLGKNPIVIFVDLQSFVDGLRSKQYESAGQGLGAFLSVALDWTTN